MKIANDLVIYEVVIKQNLSALLDISRGGGGRAPSYQAHIVNFFDMKKHSGPPCYSVQTRCCEKKLELLKTALSTINNL